MKKIGILTITRGPMNFGNRLQNYALQTVLEDLGARPETIYAAELLKHSIFLSRCKQLAKRFIKTSSRRRHFDAFDRRYIHASRLIRFGDHTPPALADEYDAFIAGSDQVWNPGFWFNSDFEYAAFAPEHKRFSYAASFGVDAIPPEHRQAVAARLRGMQAISVREERGAAIVRELTGRDAPVHVDPTMLLPPERYHAIEAPPAVALPEKYLLTFFLGQLSEEARRFAQQTAQLAGLEMIELDDLPENALFSCGPAHFLYLLHHAAYICTDSFHGTVFSILFQKPFTVFERGGTATNMESRLTTLLGRMRLESRCYGALSPRDSLSPPDYRPAAERLAAERLRGREYLQRILQSP